METPFQKLVNNKALFRLYLLKSLPMAFFAGVKVNELSDEKCITAIKHRWINQNPFGSMYFACEAMAAEMATALPILDRIYKSSPQISMLIIKNKSVFYKKATGKILFTCNDINQLDETIKKVKSTSNAFELDITVKATDESAEVVAEFIFTWSLKQKNSY